MCVKWKIDWKFSFNIDYVVFHVSFDDKKNTIFFLLISKFKIDIIIHRKMKRFLNSISSYTISCMLFVYAEWWMEFFSPLHLLFHRNINAFMMRRWSVYAVFSKKPYANMHWIKNHHFQLNGPSFFFSFYLFFSPCFHHIPNIGNTHDWMWSNSKHLLFISKQRTNYKPFDDLMKTFWRVQFEYMNYFVIYNKNDRKKRLPITCAGSWITLVFCCC